MVPDDPSPKQPPNPSAEPAPNPPRRIPRGRGAHSTTGLVIWSIVTLLVALGVFYSWRAAANRDRLTERDLRELDRMGRMVAQRAGGFAGAMRAWAWQGGGSGSAAGGRAAAAGLYRMTPELEAGPQSCASPRPPRIVAGRLSLCWRVELRDTSRVVWAAFGLDGFRRALASDLFDLTFLADDSGHVFLSVSDGPAIRLPRLPPDTSKQAAGRVSEVRRFSIAGREYKLFLQPVDIEAPRLLRDTSASRTEPARWTMGGLVSISRFRADSLALEPPHLLFLGFLLLLALLAVPYARVALMGPWESVKVADLHVLSLSLLLGGGMLGVAVADLSFYSTFSAAVDRNLAAASGRLAAAVHGEIGRALGELDRWTLAFDSVRAKQGSARDSTGIFGRAGTLPRDVAGARYLNFQMVVWMDSLGRPVAKWSPRSRNTARTPVSERAYFRRVMDGQLYSWSADSAAPARQYYLESIRSQNTGEPLAAISAPYCWDRRVSACHAPSPGARAIMTQLLSLNQPLLPPGVDIAVLDADGATLFHSESDRNLAENFFEETGQDPSLRALVAARAEGSLSASYVGRRTRMYVRPLAGTPLSLILLLDDGLPATAHFDALFVSLAVLLGWALLLWAGFVLVEMLLPGRMRWAWPDAHHPGKYRVLTQLMLGFAVVLVLQGVSAAVGRYPVSAGTFLVPVQALAVALMVQARFSLRGEHGRARDPAWIAGTALLAATVVQLPLNLAAGGPLAYRLVLELSQLAMPATAAFAVARMDPRDLTARPNDASLSAWLVGAVVGTVTVVAMLPGYLLQEESFLVHEDRLLRYEQVRLLQAGRERAAEIRAETRKGGLPAGLATLLAADPAGLATPPVIGSPVIVAPRAPQVLPAGRASVAFGPRTARRPDHCRTRTSDLGELVFAGVEQVMPFVTRAAVEVRHAARTDMQASWQSCRGGVLRLVSGDTVLTRAGLGSGAWDAKARLGALLLLLLGGGYALLWALARWIGRRVFLLDVPHCDALPLAGQLQGRADASLIVVCTRSMDREYLGRDPTLHYLDLVKLVDGGLNAALEGAPPDRRLVLDHFDHRIEEPAWSGQLLVALETLLAAGRGVVLLSSREPGAMFPLAEQVEGGVDRQTERWTRLLGRMASISVPSLDRGLPGPTPRDGTFLPTTPATRALMRECGHNARLLELAVLVRRRHDFDRLSPEAVVDQLREVADTYYRALWLILQPEEKLVVAQLAAGVVVNPECRAAIRDLLARGLAARDPELRLMNLSFSAFVREEVPSSALAGWEKASPSSPWQRLRFPILFGLAGFAGFLFVTQRGAFDSAIAIVTASALAATTILKLFTLLKPGKAD